MIDYRKWRAPRLTSYGDEPSALTPRQREIFWCVASGMTLEATAEYLDISVRTVKDQKQKIKERIPGLTCCSAYGALGVQILNAEQLAKPAESERAAAAATAGNRKHAQHSATHNASLHQSNEDPTCSESP